MSVVVSPCLPQRHCSVPYAGALFTSLVVRSCLPQRRRSVPYAGALFTSLFVSSCLPQRHRSVPYTSLWETGSNNKTGKQSTGVWN